MPLGNRRSNLVEAARHGLAHELCAAEVWHGLAFNHVVNRPSLSWQEIDAHLLSLSPHGGTHIGCRA